MDRAPFRPLSYTRYNAAGDHGTTGVLLLGLLLAGFVLLGALPEPGGAIRVGRALAALVVRRAWSRRCWPCSWRSAGSPSRRARSTPRASNDGSVARLLAVWLTPAVGAGGARGPRRARARTGSGSGSLVTLAPLIVLGWPTGGPVPGDDPRGARRRCSRWSRSRSPWACCSGRTSPWRATWRCGSGGRAGKASWSPRWPAGCSPPGGRAPDGAAAARDRVRGRAGGPAAARLGASRSAPSRRGIAWPPSPPSVSRRGAPG